MAREHEIVLLVFVGDDCKDVKAETIGPFTYVITAWPEPDLIPDEFVVDVSEGSNWL